MTRNDKQAVISHLHGVKGELRSEWAIFNQFLMNCRAREVRDLLFSRVFFMLYRPILKFRIHRKPSSVQIGNGR
jgi:hypothetical protein